jgi:hypothetical protein
MHYKISHGLFASYTGSSSAYSNNELVTTTISGPSDTLKKIEEPIESKTEVNVHHFPECKTFENLAVGIIEKILENFVVKDIDKFRSPCISVYTNTRNLSMIGNSVLIACLDAGIPLKSMFYCAGSRNLFVFSSGNGVMYHGTGRISPNMMDEMRKESERVKESVESAMADTQTIE